MNKTSTVKPTERKIPQQQWPQQPQHQQRRPQQQQRVVAEWLMCVTANPVPRVQILVTAAWGSFKFFHVKTSSSSVSCFCVHQATLCMLDSLSLPFEKIRPMSLCPNSNKRRPTSLCLPFDDTRPKSLHPPFDDTRPKSLHPPFDDTRPKSLHPPFDDTRSKNLCHSFKIACDKSQWVVQEKRIVLYKSE